MIRENPCHARTVVRPRPVPPTIVPWSRARIVAMRLAMADRYKIVMVLGAGCGLRQGELFGVSPDDLASLRAGVGEDGRVGRNTFRAGSYLDMNLALVKAFPLGESRRLVFRTEVFNFLDRANFGVPVRHLEAVGFGQATSTLTPGRRVQFHLKFSF